VTLGSNPNYNVTKTDGTLTIGKASASVTANNKSKTYGQANPAFDAVVTGAGQRRRVGLQPGDGSGPDHRRRQLPDRGDAGQQPELRGHEARWHADDWQGVGVGHGQRQEQDLRPGEPGVRCGRDRRGQRRRVGLQPGDGSGPDDRRRQLPDRGDGGQQPELRHRKDRWHADDWQGDGIGHGQRQE
jgi:hypothetical protein